MSKIDSLLSAYSQMTGILSNAINDFKDSVYIDESPKPRMKFNPNYREQIVKKQLHEFTIKGHKIMARSRKEAIKKLIIKKIIMEIIFDNNSQAFSALHKAQAWCRGMGYSYGSTDRGRRVAIQKGEYTLPQKIKNFNEEDFKNVDGYIISFDFREGTVKIQINE